MNFSHAFIVTYGRSGSTLLQGVLNAIPGATIRGENGGILHAISQIDRGLAQAEKFAAAASEPTHPWYGADDFDRRSYVDQLVEQFVRDILQPPSDATLVGFKEIRHGMQKASLDWYLDFVLDRFPGGCLIVNTRDMDSVIASNRAAGHAVSPEQLQRTDTNIRSYAERRPDRCFHVRYDDYVKDPDNLQSLHEFLGATFDRAAIESVLAQTHSVRTRPPENAPNENPVA